VIALDTNVVVRFIVEDDVEQSEKARAFFESLRRDETFGFVCDIVICEIVWVLESCYRFKRAEIAATLRSLLRTRDLCFESPDQVAHAVNRYQAGKGDVADYLIDEVGRARGCTSTATFDRGLANDKRFILLQSGAGNRSRKP
jgi:predicted nucleic-acid-binding protein